MRSIRQDDAPLLDLALPVLFEIAQSPQRLRQVFFPQ
jgi:hypothetical protein